MLARACENEAENAKRMRVGMEPISQPLPLPLPYSSPLDMMTSTSPVTMTVTMQGAGDNKTKVEYKPEQLATLLAATQQQQPAITTVNTAMAAAAGTPVVNGGTTMYRQQQAVYPSQPVAAALMPGTLPISNGGGVQVDGLKKPPLLNHKLNGTEMAAVRQLITGYRESAAFLLRSADELEHLLNIQPKL